MCDKPHTQHWVDIDINDYDYPLPDERIAAHPLAERDQCRLLLSDATGRLEDHTFAELPQLLSPHALLIRNNTRVIKARIFFVKATGARIEILCLDPYKPVSYEESLASLGSCSWHCLVGNSKKWRPEQTISCTLPLADGQSIALQASRAAETPDVVTFSWSDETKSFGEILELCGQLPIPPYLNRETESSDLTDYQTVYARIEGSVAAPTAGLHFTPELDDRLLAEGHRITELTLHVGAGTFLPVKGCQVAEHQMHSEYCSVPTATLEMLLEHIDSPFVPIGTTSVRTLESLYWYAVALQQAEQEGGEVAEPFHLDQWYSYRMRQSCGATLPSRREALELLLRYARHRGLDRLTFSTALLIAPGYQYHMVDILVTNFHQPKSTLLLLVSALIGPHWRSLYEHALADAQYRFLSYGDACLLYRQDL